MEMIGQFKASLTTPTKTKKTNMEQQLLRLIGCYLYYLFALESKGGDKLTIQQKEMFIYCKHCSSFDK